MFFQGSKIMRRQNAGAELIFHQFTDIIADSENELNQITFMTPSH